MAGLQYNFFPTDFFYPRPETTRGDTTSTAVLPLQTQKRDTADDPASSTGNKINGVSVQKQEQEQGRISLKAKGKSVRFASRRSGSLFSWSPEDQLLDSS